MVTSVIFDGEAHLSNPDKNEVTHCGVDWSQVSKYELFSAAYNIGFLVPLVEDKHDVERCEECIRNGVKWAIPEDELESMTEEEIERAIANSMS